MARLERDKAEQVVRVLVGLFESANPFVRPEGDRLPLGEFLAGAQASALAQLTGTPAVKAKLQQVFGLIHYERGQYGAAREAIEAALAAQRRLAGPDDPEALESLLALGSVLRELGERSRATALLQESLDRHRRVYGEEHAKTAAALSALASAIEGEDHRRAGTLLTQALAIRRRLPASDPDLAASLGALAQYHRQRGELGEARALYLEALGVFRDPLKRSHPRFVRVMNDYASLLEALNAHADAEALLREAISLGERVLGRTTLTVANLINSHAVALTSMGHLADAERAFRETFDLHRELVGEDHWRMRNVVRNVGQILALQERYDDALPWMDRAMAVRSEAASAEDPGLMGIRAQRALIIHRLGRPQEALAEVTAAVMALQKMRATLGPYWLAQARLAHGRILVDMGRPHEAEPPLQAAADWFNRYGADSPRHAEARCALGLVQMLAGARTEVLPRWTGGFQPTVCGDRPTGGSSHRLNAQPPARADVGRMSRSPSLLEA